MVPGEPGTARYFLIGAWLAAWLAFPASRRKKCCQNFHPPHSQKLYQIGFWSNQSSTGSKLWYESEQMFRLPSYLKKKKKKISQTSWRRPIPNDHLKLRINFKSSKYQDHLKMPCWHGKCPTSWNPGPNFENYFLNFIIRPPSNHVYRSLGSLLGGSKSETRERSFHSEIKENIMKSRTQFENYFLNFYHEASLEPRSCRNLIPSWSLPNKRSSPSISNFEFRFITRVRNLCTQLKCHRESTNTNTCFGDPQPLDI